MSYCVVLYLARCLGDNNMCVQLVKGRCEVISAKMACASYTGGPALDTNLVSFRYLLIGCSAHYADICTLLDSEL